MFCNFQLQNNWLKNSPEVIRRIFHVRRRSTAANKLIAKRRSICFAKFIFAKHCVNFAGGYFQQNWHKSLCPRKIIFRGQIDRVNAINLFRKHEVCETLMFVVAGGYTATTNCFAKINFAKQSRRSITSGGDTGAEGGPIWPSAD